jgi:hypothetical protein
MADPLTIGGRYRIPSGMGGVFDVRLVALDGATAHVRVDMKPNPDWHGVPLTCAAVDLYPIPKRFQVRTRVTGSGEGQFLSWGSYPDKAEAQREADRANTYPSCRPVHIVMVEA